MGLRKARILASLGGLSNPRFPLSLGQKGLDGTSVETLGMSAPTNRGGALRPQDSEEPSDCTETSE